MSEHHHDLEKTALGKKTTYSSQYQPDLLFPIPRQTAREAMGLSTLPFQGKDIWNAYEFSWLNSKGKPIVAGVEFIFPCESPFLIESKSFKLYLNSFSHSQFESSRIVENLLTRDLSAASGMAVTVKLFSLEDAALRIANSLPGILLDDLDIRCDTYKINPAFLKTESNKVVEETLTSNLLKSNCPVTGQPDWGSVQIRYTGKKIEAEGLLKYIVSYRQHDEFHEHCVEQMFVDIMQYCQPETLCVYARYTRRGGLDINPYRANDAISLENTRLWRQ